jgi:multiple sugar transport system ATP-binding protein
MSDGKLSGLGYQIAIDGESEYEGREIVWGIRPQACTVADDGQLRGAVDAVERLGSEGFVYAKTEAGMVTARFDSAQGSKLKVGDPIGIRVDPQAIYLFDAKTEVAIPLNRSTPLGAAAP